MRKKIKLNKINQTPLCIYKTNQPFFPVKATLKKFKKPKKINKETQFQMAHEIGLPICIYTRLFFSSVITH